MVGVLLIRVRPGGSMTDKETCEKFTVETNLMIGLESEGLSRYDIKHGKCCNYYRQLLDTISMVLSKDKISVYI